MKKRFCYGAMKRITAMLLTVLCMVGAAGSARTETKLMVVSDLHYLEPSLYQGSELFLRVLRAGDGKITQCGEELLSALYQEILFEQPNALIVTGDLTFNGEKISHEALAVWFGTVEDAGVDVWVIPGNHDINVANPIGFADGMYYGVEAASPDAFAAIYADYSAPGEAGFSYIARISDGLWVAMTDVAWYQDQALTFGLFTGSHAAWLEEALKTADEAGAQVVTATHHNLLAHTEFSKESFQMFGHESMAALARAYGVKLNLSGHMHIQHIARENGLTDTALGAFCIWPHRYALVTLGNDGSLRYEAKALSSRFLPEGFLEESKAWFAGITRDKVKALLDGTDEEIAMMADYAAKFNLAYFSGTYRKEDASWFGDPAYALWENQADTAFFPYMKLVMNEAAGDNLHWGQ